MKSHSEINTAPVSGFARSFISGDPIVGAAITVVENSNLKFYTDKDGKFGPFMWPVGQPVTLVLEKNSSWWQGYHTTQTATLIVPPEGINDSNHLNNVSFQVPSNFAFQLLSVAIGIPEDKNACQIAATITPPETTMNDIPQGVCDVEVSLTPDPKIKPFYFGIFPLIHKTNPFSHHLRATSHDGGVGFFNVPEGTYVLSAKKNGHEFTHATINARKGVLVNASPPYCPKLLHPPKENTAKKTNHFHFFKPAVVVGIGAIGLATAGLGGALAGAAVGYLSSSAAESLSESCDKRIK